MEMIKERILVRKLSLFLCLLGGVSAAIGQDRLPLIPLQGKSISIVADGKVKNYYKLTKNSPIRIQADGPGKLLILSRLSLTDKSKSSESYTIKVMEGKTVVKSHSSTTGKSNASYSNSDAIPGKSRKFSIKIPKDSHTFSVFLENTYADDASLKFYFVPTKAERTQNLVTLEPLSYDKVVHIMEDHDKLISYYTSSVQRKVELRVVGPTNLKVRSRLNYDSKMGENQAYSISIWEEGKKISTKTLSTKPAAKSAYQEWKDIVPGVLNTFFLNVPEGEHTYKFSLEGKTASSIALKFSIPRQDRENED